MKVRMLVSMASENEVKDVGDEIEVKKEIGEAWEKAGIAEIVEEKKGKKKGDK
ncbi:hypothetical protein J5S49_13500 [Virgibacillus halodenitrificans]|uniref:hypothetical protein n=1 Tax=Virgibacillus halodenitrificans TaxID=1482 RepID=UPI001F2557C8|nr:hypothetical protein [Virgibacillus halodenitrificans]MCG1029307.1 hypothetical protein [Virgibacillus halodenitrificans]